MRQIQKLLTWWAILLAIFITAGCASRPGAPTTAATQAPTISPAMKSTEVIPETGETPTLAPSDTAQAQTAAAKSGPACSAPAAVTMAMTEGPYFKAGSPERTNLLETGIPGKKLTLTGWVLTPDCKPVSGALLDFWQADGEGKYDNSGYLLRGHQYTDANGRYELTTVVPGEYPGRTEHIHVKVQAPGGTILTTQLFFPGETTNQSDRIFDPSLLVTDLGQADGMHAQYTFIVSAQD